MGDAFTIVLLAVGSLAGAAVMFIIQKVTAKVSPTVSDDDKAAEAQTAVEVARDVIDAAAAEKVTEIDDALASDSPEKALADLLNSGGN